MTPSGLFMRRGLTARRVGKANGSGRSLPSGRPDDRLRVPTFRATARVGTARKSRAFAHPTDRGHRCAKMHR